MLLELPMVLFFPIHLKKIKTIQYMFRFFFLRKENHWSISSLQRPRRYLAKYDPLLCVQKYLYHMVLENNKLFVFQRCHRYYR